MIGKYAQRALTLPPANNRIRIVKKERKDKNMNGVMLKRGSDTYTRVVAIRGGA
jgi:hypothetical protein